MEKELAFCAYLIYPSRKSALFQLGKDRVNPKLVMSILEQNRTPLLFIDRANPTTKAFSQWEGFRESEQKERKKLADWSIEYQRINTSFATRRIDHILSKLYLGLPHLEDNLDMIVKRENMVEIHQILGRLGFTEITAPREPYLFRYVKFFSEHSKYQVNLSHNVPSDLTFFDQKLVWKNAQKNVRSDLTFFTFSPESSILFNIARSMYVDRAFTLPQVILLIHHLKSVGGNWGALAEIAERNGWQDGFYAGIHALSRMEEKIYGSGSIFDRNLVSEADRKCNESMKKFVRKKTAKNFQPPLQLKEKLGKSFYFRKYTSDGSSPNKFLGTLKYYLHRIGSLFAPPSRPFIISFSGIEGSGKSSCTACMKNVLSSCGVRVHVYENRKGRDKILSYIAKRRKILVEERQKSYEKASDTPISETILQEKMFAKKTLTFTHLLSLTLAYLYGVRLPMLRGKVVICDRYVYDSLIDIASLHDRSDIRKGISSRLLLMLWRKPDISFFCDVPVETAIRRVEASKQTYPEEFLLKRFGLNYLMSSSFKFTSINCHSRTEEVERAIIRKTLQDYFGE